MPGSSGEGCDRVRDEPPLQRIEPGSRKSGEDVAGEEVTLFQVGVAAEDKRPHPHVHIAIELCQDLIGIADDGAATAAPREPDPAPEMRLQVEVLALGAELIL